MRFVYLNEIAITIYPFKLPSSKTRDVKERGGEREGGREREKEGERERERGEGINFKSRVDIIVKREMGL